MAYRFNPPPQDATKLPEFLTFELQRIQEALAGYQEYLALGVTNVLPDRPRDGYLYYADGTNWNPGSGEGIYAYYNSAWNKL